MTQALQDNDIASSHRQRLLEGMAHAVAAKGYAETTIADIVREAAVSRRTFYEHFTTKADCLIALYEAANRSALAVLREAIDPAQDWQEQVEKAMSAYFACLAQNPTLVRTLFVEILGLGAEGLAVRRRANEEIVAFMLQVINGGRKRKAPLSAEMAMAVVGGINELVLQAIERNRVGDLKALAAPAIALLQAVTRDTA
ncbi:helix-turn-helix domain-containing protein [Noviherbaspirillum sp.]|uniref:TetR/AcrR family transcriptional regulator n=1 Tax=Noviherbaspirillum sp. TaxID=1926288 RepID=UPI002B49E899|nr:helix-turn-helix domain-containing protein [Noviherbaspirillum sp.]HJV79402.1 helix-turn-helix domain-containing protein [Noviherbaspirillum sp.]